MNVYTVQVYRTDTHKENDHVVALYKEESNAQKHADDLNSLYAKDEYCTLRARVEVMPINDMER